MASRAFKTNPRKPVTSDPDTKRGQADELDPATIAARAYECWEERGYPIRSDQEDWFRAEAELRAAEAEMYQPYEEDAAPN